MIYITYQNVNTKTIINNYCTYTVYSAKTGITKHHISKHIWFNLKTGECNSDRYKLISFEEKGKLIKVVDKEEEELVTEMSTKFSKYKKNL